MPKYVMNDGREFTDYNASCVLNNLIQTKYKISNSHEYREFLQKNSSQVMKDLADCTPKQGCTLCPVCKSSLSV